MIVTDFERISSESQIKRCAQLARHIWTEHYVPIVGADQVDYMLDKFQSDEAMRGHIGEGWIYYLARVGNEDAGYFALKPECGKVMLSKFYVRKEYRGKGIARMMIELIKNICAELGAGEIYLTVNKNNSGSIAAYEKLGFVKSASLVTDIGSGFVMDDYKYTMKL